MNKKHRTMRNQIITAAILYICGMAVGHLNILYVEYLSLGFYLIAYVVIGHTVLKKAYRNIKRGDMFDENLLMSIATIGALLIGEYPESVAVMLFYNVGELFQALAVNKSRKSIGALMDIRPDYVNKLMDDGSIVKIDPNELHIGEVFIVKPGEKVAIDGVVLEGSAMLDTVALTGESVPRAIRAGMDIMSGSINTDGVLKVSSSKEFEESTASKILEMVEHASSKKSKTEDFITRFARVYTPIVVICAIAIAFIPPWIFEPRDFKVWIYRALAFLVVSCPCALVISVPLSFFGGIGAASRQGILVKGSNYIETLSKVKTAVFDKTGTLTEGVFEVVDVLPSGISKKELIELACFAESFSSHPIALSIKNEAFKLGIKDVTLSEGTNQPDCSNKRLSRYRAIAGKGVEAYLDGKHLLVGNAQLLQDECIDFVKPVKVSGTVVYTAYDGEYKGCIVISDKLRSDADIAISGLRDVGIKHMIMLTGDGEYVAGEISEHLGMDSYFAGLLPADKLFRLEKLLSEQKKDEKLLFVGDGINDAPVLARADVGVAMGGLGADAAIEAADMVIMNDQPSKLITAIKISRRTLNIAKQNIVFAIGIKVLVLILVALGISDMWMAVFSDVGVAIIAIFNSMRNLSIRNL